MGKYQIKKPEYKDALITVCKDQGDDIMDTIGYFLIRVNGSWLEVGLCSYSETNKITTIWRGKKPQDIYRQIIEDKAISRMDHCAYLGKELARAYICMNTKVRYVQDGKVDGTFPEIDWLKKTNEALE